ncbi:LacI family DNA-binding transcriptional regulator [Microlunatus endophyticus]
MIALHGVSKREECPLSPAEDRPTLAQIAAASGVSVSTVSKVLNRRGDVGAATRQRLEQALSQYGYVRRRQTEPSLEPVPTIDLVVRGLDGSWAASAASGAEATAYEAGFRVVISVARPPTEQGDWVDAVIAAGSQGVLLGLVDLVGDELLRLQHANIPYVVIDPLADPPTGAYSVGTSNWAGAHEATQYLIDHGHRAIALITGPAQHLYVHARIAGFRSAMAAAGLTVRPEHIRHGTYDRASGRELTAAVLATSPRPTALFICSDHMAIGGYEAIAEAGLKVPDDISVVGFDDLPEARWVHPNLTTVRQPIKDMAASATSTLIRLIHGVRVDSRRQELATALIERESTRDLGHRPAR